MRATLERRILVNYRVDLGAVAAVLPSPFRPLDVDGYAIAGICLIRLGRIRPAGLPASVGLTTESAAHRVAVQWETPDGPATGVYIPRRDTDSRLTALLGGRVFPGWHHRARFTVTEGDGRFLVRMASRDGGARIVVAAHVADQVMPGAVLGDVSTASRFFSCAPIGYSARPDGVTFDGVELGSTGWNIQPLTVDEIASSFFDDASRFPAGTVALDSAFLMKDLETTWSPQPRLRAGAEPIGFAATAPSPADLGTASW